jgi:hypothetical protein
MFYRVSNGGTIVNFEKTNALANGGSSSYSGTLQEDGILVITSNGVFSTSNYTCKINGVTQPMPTYTSHSWGSATVWTAAYNISAGDKVQIYTTNSGWTLCVLYLH